MKRVVVIGNGMVGSRFVDELMREASRCDAKFDVTILGDEPYEAYNRLMLSEVIAGRAEIGALTLPAPPEGIVVHSGVAAQSIERSRRIVIDAEGRAHPYDVLVLATGADAALPAIPGLRAARGRDVHTVRTIDDCRELLAAASMSTPEAPRRMAVLGGGLLGVEIACGLRARGVDVSLVHRGTHVMDRQIDAPSGVMAGATLADLGIDVRTGSGITRVLRSKGRVTGVELIDGTCLDVDDLVVNTGVRPRVDLARAAGVPVDVGVLVDTRLRVLDDESVAAIGDCAQTDVGCPGLIAPGWDQAARLAHDLCHGTPVGSAEPGEHVADELSIVKLKAVGLETVVLGDRIPDPFVAHERGLRVVTLSDVGARRSATVAVDGDRIVAAVIIGSARMAADLTATYERRTPLPLDPAHLLVKGASTSGLVPETASPTALPSGATVCRCNGVTKGDVVDAHVQGARSVEAVASETRATTGCGGCTSTVCGILKWMDEVDPVDEKVAV
ncbi:FAD-dependent oxidoreductase [Dermacoccus nishinomiyaensis]|mgnify:FL=1|uniref:FAD-dependent oxidoreductase n=1 Tax=Dermacoccus nishinomiyaensis TaxID=1274 RepID=UPI00248F36BD|nr:FAD-dependent oxidoreductase [Dermacoccus nishinomiyaensis]